MKRSSSEAVDENAWNVEDQREPSKKVKSEDVILQIDLPACPGAPEALHVEGGNVSHANGGHQNGQDEGGQNGQAGDIHSNGQAEAEYQNGHSGEISNGHPVEAAANGRSIEDDLDQLYQDYGYGAADDLDTQPKPAEFSEVEVTSNTENLVESLQEERANDVPDGRDQKQETEKTQQNLVKEDETAEEPMELKVSEGADEEFDSDEEKDEITSEDKAWYNQKLQTTELCGHAYKINAIDMAGKTLVSASEDTTIKAWDTETKMEICSMSGHKEAVTAVKILDLASSKAIYSDGGQVVISGSTDCYAKFWHIPTGRELTSIYTFNAITCVEYICNDDILVTATDGGKLELFDAKSGKNLSSALAFELPVVSMKVIGDMIICGDPQSRLQVWIVKDRKLNCRRSSNGMETSRPNLSSIDFYGAEFVIAGMYSGSVKKMSWINGAISKLRHGDRDQVDALQVRDDLMVVATSAKETYLLNFYDLPSGVYLGSTPGFEAMNSVAAACVGGRWNFATGGEKLRLWQCISLDDKECKTTAEISSLPQSEKSLVDTSDSEDEEADSPVQEKSTGLLSNCILM